MGSNWLLADQVAPLKLTYRAKAGQAKVKSPWHCSFISWNEDIDITEICISETVQLWDVGFESKRDLSHALVMYFFSHWVWILFA